MSITQVIGIVFPTVFIVIPALIIVYNVGIREEREQFRREHPRPRFL